MSCNSQKSPSKSDGDIDSFHIEMLEKESVGGYENSKYLVVKDQEMLEVIYGKVNIIRKPGLTIPKIDWENEMVIALFMGQKNSGGYSITLHQASLLDNGKIEYLIKETKPQGMVTTMITQPFYFCKVQRTNKEVLFKKVE